MRMVRLEVSEIPRCQKRLPLLLCFRQDTAQGDKTCIVLHSAHLLIQCCNLGGLGLESVIHSELSRVCIQMYVQTACNLYQA